MVSAVASDVLASPVTNTFEAIVRCRTGKAVITGNTNSGRVIVSLKVGQESLALERVRVGKVVIGSIVKVGIVGAVTSDQVGSAALNNAK